jgi:hypothetical protein
MKTFNRLVFLVLILSSGVCHAQIYASNISKMMRFYEIDKKDAKAVEFLIKQVGPLTKTKFNILLKNYKAFLPFKNVDDAIMSIYGLQESDRDAVKEIIKTQDVVKLLYMKPFDLKNLLRNRSQELTLSRRKTVNAIMNMYGIDESKRSFVESLCKKINYEGDLNAVGRAAQQAMEKSKVNPADNTVKKADVLYVPGTLRSEGSTKDVVAPEILFPITAKTKLIDYFMAVMEALNSQEYASKEFPKLQLMTDKDLVLKAINEMSMELIDDGHLSDMSINLLSDKEVRAKMISILNARSQKGIFDAIKAQVSENSEGQEIDPEWENSLQSTKLTVAQIKSTISDYLAKKLTAADITSLINDGVLAKFVSGAKTSKDVTRIESLMENISSGFELNVDQAKIISNITSDLEAIKTKISKAQFIEDGKGILTLYTISTKDIKSSDLVIRAMELAEKGLKSSADSKEYKQAVTAFIRPESAYLIESVADKYDVDGYSTYMFNVADLVRKASEELSLTESSARVETLRLKLEEFREFRESKVLVK